MNLRFLSLASGSSGNCYYLGNFRYGILIDAGIGIRTIKKRLSENNIPLESILALFITHDHADHIKAAGCLGEKYHIPVYTTEQIHVGMNHNYCMREKIVSAKRIIEKDRPLKLQDFVITPFEVPHDGSDNIGYLIEYNRQKIAFSADLGYIPEQVADYLRQADYLVIESNYDEEMLRHGPYPYHLKHRIANKYGHMNNAETADFLAHNITPQLKYIFLCHLSKENNLPELAYKTVEQRLSQEGIIVGKDVKLITLARNNPSQLYVF